MPPPKPSRRCGQQWAYDGDTSQSLQFAITDGNSDGIFGVERASGRVVVVRGDRLDYETQSQYTLTITATDNGQPSRQGSGTLTVLVDDVNESPIFLDLRERVEGEYVGPLPVADPDTGDSLSFTIQGDDRFEIVAGALKLKAGQSLDLAQESHVDLQITATDTGQPALSRTQTFVVLVQQNLHPWQNPIEVHDVTGQGSVEPNDVLVLINAINSRSVTGTTTALPTVRPAAKPYLDPSGDDHLHPQDVLMIINYLNGRAAAGEGEASTSMMLQRHAVQVETAVLRDLFTHPGNASNFCPVRSRNIQLAARPDRASPLDEDWLLAADQDHEGNPVWKHLSLLDEDWLLAADVAEVWDTILDDLSPQISREWTRTE